MTASSFYKTKQFKRKLGEGLIITITLQTEK